MNIVCPECLQKYDDVYHSTQCPHEYFQMHTIVFVDGKHGCAHTIEELSQTTAPNQDCGQLLLLLELQNFDWSSVDAVCDCELHRLSKQERTDLFDRAIDDINAEIAANGGSLPNESCHFGDCEQEII